MNIGVSNCTKDKQKALDMILRLHLKIVKNIFFNNRKRGWRFFEKYIYVETNAGDGGNAIVGDGSPIIFLKAAIDTGIPYTALFVEREKENVVKLRDRVNELGATDVCIIEGDNEAKEVVDKLKAPYWQKNICYGLAYADPNGVPNTAMLEAISQNIPKMEILIRANTRIMKRVTASPVHKSCRLTDVMNQINKKIWVIREKYEKDRHQDWTFLFGSNFLSTEWKKQGFYNVESEYGQKLLLEFGYTKKEREVMV